MSKKTNSIAQEVKDTKAKLLGQMTTSQILWHVIKRHRVFLLILWIVISHTWYVVTNFETATTNFLK